MSVSIVIFAACGYVAGTIAENLIDTIAHEKNKGHNIDIFNNHTDLKDFNNLSNNGNSQFKLITPDAFERVSSQGK